MLPWKKQDVMVKGIKNKLWRGGEVEGWEWRGGEVEGWGSGSVVTYPLCFRGSYDSRPYYLYCWGLAEVHLADGAPDLGVWVHSGQG